MPGMRRRFTAVVWVLALLASAAASANDAQHPVVLAKNGAWRLRYQDDSCWLGGVFGAGDQQIIAIFTRYQPSDAFRLQLIGKSLGGNDLHVDVMLAFGNAPPHQYKALGGQSDGKPSLWLSDQRLDNAPVRIGTMPPVTPEQEAAADSLTVRAGHGTWYRLQTGSMKAPMAAIRTCTTDLVHTWGYDPAVQASLMRPATPTSNPADWLNSRDYPYPALTEGRSGITQFRLDIDEAGGVAGCHIQDKVGKPDLALVACNVIARRAKFKPGLDAAGKAVKSYFVRSVLWEAG